MFRILSITAVFFSTVAFAGPDRNERNDRRCNPDIEECFGGYEHRVGAREVHTDVSVETAELSPCFNAKAAAMFWIMELAQAELDLAACYAAGDDSGAIVPGDVPTGTIETGGIEECLEERLHRDMCDDEVSWALQAYAECRGLHG